MSLRSTKLEQETGARACTIVIIIVIIMLAAAMIIDTYSEMFDRNMIKWCVSVSVSVCVCARVCVSSDVATLIRELGCERQEI